MAGKPRATASQNPADSSQPQARNLAIRRGIRDDGPKSPPQGVPPMNPTERRTFLKGLGAGAAALALSPAPLSADDSSRIMLGIIGPGGMGMNHLRRLAARKEVEVAYVCDPDQNRLAAAAKETETRSGKAPKTVKD